MNFARTIFRFLCRWKRSVSVCGVVCGLSVSLSAQSISDSRSSQIYKSTPQLTAREHPWGRFVPQTWARTQTTTTTRQNGQQICSVSEAKTTLESVGNDSVTLNVVSSVDIGGRNVPTSQQRVVADFFQEPLAEGVRVNSLPSTTLMVDNQMVPCAVRTYETVSPDTRGKTTVWFSTQIYPYLLRVEKVMKSNATNGRVLCQSTTEVVETGASEIRTSKQGTYRLRTVATNAGMTTISESSCSRHVPGGVLQETVREFAPDGSMIRSSDTRLINYRYVVPDNTTGTTNKVVYQTPLTPSPYPSSSTQSPVVSWTPSNVVQQQPMQVLPQLPRNVVQQPSMYIGPRSPAGSYPQPPVGTYPPPIGAYPQPPPFPPYSMPPRPYPEAFFDGSAPGAPPNFYADPSRRSYQEPPPRYRRRR